MSMIKVRVIYDTACVRFLRVDFNAKTGFEHSLNSTFYYILMCARALTEPSIQQCRFMTEERLNQDKINSSIVQP